MQRLDRQFRALTRACFECHGHGYAELLCSWTAVVGDELAALASPIRLRPQGVEGRELGRVLIVRVREGRALEVQHQSARIVERINGFFGYRAVRAIKVLQAPFAEHEEGSSRLIQPSPSARRTVEARLGPIADPRLKDALRRLGCSIAVSNTTR